MMKRWTVSGKTPISAYYTFMKRSSFRQRRSWHRAPLQFARHAQPHEAGRSVSFEPLESRVMLDADVVISEVVASNSLGLLDYNDDDSDWIEILNRGPSRVNLEGWYLTDDPGDLTKWQFPISTILAAGERHLVFASNDDYVAANGELHTNFRLNGDGEFLALVNPEGTVVYGFDPAFPSQARDVSYGLEENIQVTRLVNSGAPATGLVPTDSGLAATWTGGDEPFDETDWTRGTTGVGYDTGQIGGPLSPPLAYWTFDELIHGGPR